MCAKIPLKRIFVKISAFSKKFYIVSQKKSWYITIKVTRWWICVYILYNRSEKDKKMNLKELLKNHYVLTDGAMGTYYNLKYPAANQAAELANITRPWQCMCGFPECQIGSSRVPCRGVDCRWYRPCAWTGSIRWWRTDSTVWNDGRCINSFWCRNDFILNHSIFKTYSSNDQIHQSSGKSCDYD